MSAGQPIMHVRGVPIRWDGEAVRFEGGMTIDADGSPRAYHPQDKGLDYLANAGHPGNWWGVVTDDEDGKPIIQGPGMPAPGYYVSTTSYMHKGVLRTSPAAYVNSEEVSFIVIPAPLRMKLKPKFIGSKARITYQGKSVDAVVADIGPATHLGEASIAAAKALGIPSDPKRGGVAAGVLYEIWPGVPAVVNGVTYQL